MAQEQVVSAPPVLEQVLAVLHEADDRAKEARELAARAIRFTKQNLLSKRALGVAGEAFDRLEKAAERMRSAEHMIARREGKKSRWDA